MNYGQSAEKFMAAVHNLLLPLISNEAQAFGAALNECSHGLGNLNRLQLDKDIQPKIKKLDRFMDTGVLADPEGLGLYAVKAATLTRAEKCELSVLILEIAQWFDSNKR